MLETKFHTHTKQLVEDGIWKIRTNKELTGLYNYPDIVAEIRSRRIAWLGHLIRMDQGQMVRKLFDGKPGGRKRAGRPSQVAR
jgi:hypothetical protein